MAIFECTSPVTRRSLMNRSKADLADRVLELHEEIGRVRDRLEKMEARAEAAEASMQAAREWIGERAVGTIDRSGVRVIWLLGKDGEDRVNLRPLAAILQPGPAETAAAEAKKMAGFLDVVLGEPWIEAALAPLADEIAEALAPLFAPAPVRDSALPAVGSFHG